MRRNALVIVVGMLCLLAVARLSFPPPPVRTDRQAFARIKLGMSLPEAEAVIGGPPGCYTQHPGFDLHMGAYAEFEGTGSPDWQWVHWWHDAGHICLGLDQEQRVRYKGRKMVSWSWDRTGLRHFLPWHWW